MDFPQQRCYIYVGLIWEIKILIYERSYEMGQASFYT